MARYKASRKGAGRRKLSEADKKLFKVAKLWFAMGGAISSVANAAAIANMWRAKDLRDKAQQKITRRKPPVEPNVITTRGTYKKSSVALPAPAPPRYYESWSLNIIESAQSGFEHKTVRNVITGQSDKVTFPKYIVGTVRGSDDTQKGRVNGKTVPYYLETGEGSQMRYFRQVPAIPRDGKGVDKPGRWDGATWRDEYTKNPRKIKTPTFQKEIWWQALHRFDMVPDEPALGGYEPTHDFAWRKVSVSQKASRSWMQSSWMTIQKQHRKYLKKGKDAFPAFARKFIKVSKKGEYRI
jgi:hypothetical protein